MVAMEVAILDWELMRTVWPCAPRDLYYNKAVVC